jgi:hypothetical protein
MIEREPSVGSLRWFGAWKNRTWKVRGRREAYANGRGRYEILRFADNEGDGFDVRYSRPYDMSGYGQLIGATVPTEREAIALAQAHYEKCHDQAN